MFDTRADSAQQGAPINAKTILTPSVLKNVLFPDILEPVTIAMFPRLCKWKSLEILAPLLSNGCPTIEKLSWYCSSVISGKIKDGFEQWNPAKLLIASNSPITD